MRYTFRSSRATERSDSPGNDQPGADGWITRCVPWRELTHSCSDGLDVTIFWCPATDDLMVGGYDRRSSVWFELRPERHSALDAFYHPYMYVAGNDVHYDDR